MPSRSGPAFCGRLAFRWLAGALLSLACLAVGCGAGGGHIEQIRIVPAHVITVEELHARVRRAPYELGTRLGEVRLVATLTQLPIGCPSGQFDCGKGDRVRYRFADESGAREVLVEVIGPEATRMRVGGRYVLYGSAEVRPDSAARWALIAQVHAEVVP